MASFGGNTSEQPTKIFFHENAKSRMFSPSKVPHYMVSWGDAWEQGCWCRAKNTTSFTFLHSYAHTGSDSCGVSNSAGPSSICTWSLEWVATGPEHHQPPSQHHPHILTSHTHTLIPSHGGCNWGYWDTYARTLACNIAAPSRAPVHHCHRRGNSDNSVAISETSEVSNCSLPKIAFPD